MWYSSLCSPWNLYYFILIHKITPCAPSASLLIKSQTFYTRVMTQSSVEPARGCVTRAFIFPWPETENSQKRRSQSDEQKTKSQQRRANYRGIWGPSRAKARPRSAEPPAACTASAAAPRARSVRPASPWQPCSSWPSLSATVSQSHLPVLKSPYDMWYMIW